MILSLEWKLFRGSQSKFDVLTRTIVERLPALIGFRFVRHGSERSLRDVSIQG
jgi:hypothetical protein